MQDYTIGENFTLPSLGKVYDYPINPEIKLRSMTTEEEMKRVAAVDHPYKNMSEIIDDCLVEGPGISSYDMCIGDYQFLLHKLRVVTYGPDYAVVNQCIYCGCQNEDTINLDDLPVMTYTDDYETYKEFDLPKTKKHIKLRPQTPRLLDEVNARTREIKRKFKDMTSDPTLVPLLSALVETVDGRYLEPNELEQWIRHLPMADTNSILQHADKMNTTIGINTELTCECSVCGLSFKTGLKTTSEFFRPALNI